MLWSLTKVILFVVLVAALALGAGLLSETGETMRLTVAGWEFTIGPVQAAVLALMIVIAVWLLLKALGLVGASFRFLNGDETAISRYFDRNRERKGYRALSEGLMALASGEPRLALSRAQNAERLLGKPELTTLLVAQAAEAAGDRKRATEAYKTLLRDDATRFVGVRGLLQQKLADGDREVALKLAEKAFELRPGHAETQDILLKLQSDSGDWSGARTTLGAKLRAGTLPKDVYRRRDAVLALQQARTVMDDTASIEAREAAIEANRLSPDLIPAAAMAGRGYLAKGDKKNATRVLKKAWEVLPHPDLAAVFAEIEPEESPQDRLKRFRTLTNARPDSDETRMLLAELLLATEDFPGARRALDDIATRAPTQRSLAILAAIARGEGAEDSIVRDLVARAIAAPRGPQWVCDKCQAIHDGWQPICENCGSFDTLSWRTPPATSSSPALAELLPLMEARHGPRPEPLVAEDEPLPPDEITRRAN
ncbi:heme biosynthesis HemY N-terminal domain-containing protein [Tabrizicola sp.]|uniref:heme biosynthesis protein HemY n=1 Tax=Tabrizicola sp. TaxID=2005166 RepID=UPI0025F1546B|nr:heme biosynthesis HemY N-terminal domain-containing protein [Tabrizicola sp.]MBY0350603.1 heme biosynthesis protein HemY [Tabrizicola sp.]MDK2774709.1 heme biosynthesis protein HemY [Tabrizicola sp.]